MTDSHPTGVHFRARGRMAFHTIWDHITRPIARIIDDVPWCAEAISPEWMTAVMCRNVKGAQAVLVEVCGGDQGSSVRRRLKVTYNDEGRKAHLQEDLFCKTILIRVSAHQKAADCRFDENQWLSEILASPGASSGGGRPCCLGDA